jgi:DNA-binding transcriptional regulator YdaS (Cro superfamily)
MPTPLVRKRKITDEGLKKAVEKAGSYYRLAKLLNLTPTAVLEWKQVPMHRVFEVEAATGVSRETLRPDYFSKRRP